MDLVLDDLFESSENSSDSDSSSSEEDFELNTFQFVCQAALLQRNRRNSILKYSEITIPQYTDKEFLTHFRLSRDVTQNCIETFEKSNVYTKISYVHGLEKISAAKHIYTFLWFVGHETSSYRDVADRFDISISTLFDIISRVTDFLCGLPLIKWPNATEAQKTKDFFSQKRGFPGIVGIVDGTHVRINRPKQDPDSYINRKQYYSIQVQLVCNESNKIIDAFIGYPGSAHDARVYRNSPLANMAQESLYGGYLLGDSAYPCLTTLIVPYKDNGRLTHIQKKFNQKLSSCRVTIEHTNGLLKQRFRQLYHLNLRNIRRICKIIKSCCVLHNMANASDIAIFAEENLIEDPMANNDNDFNGDYEENGNRLRNEIANQLQL